MAHESYWIGLFVGPGAPSLRDFTLATVALGAATVFLSCSARADASAQSAPGLARSDAVPRSRSVQRGFDGMMPALLGNRLNRSEKPT